MVRDWAITYIQRNDLRNLIILLEDGLDVLKTDDTGQTLLHIAANFNKNPEVKDMVNWLNDHEHVGQEGQLLNKQDNRGRTALHVAAISNNWQCIDALLDLGADRTLKDEHGFTALELAKFWDSNDSASVLQRPSLKL